jgi:hypothetical protein
MDQLPRPVGATIVVNRHLDLARVEQQRLVRSRVAAGGSSTVPLAATGSSGSGGSGDGSSGDGDAGRLAPLRGDRGGGPGDALPEDGGEALV